MKQRELPFSIDGSGFWVMRNFPRYEEVAHFDLESQAKIVCDELNAAWEAGRLLSKEEIRFAWEEGFKLCRSYADNHFHFQGEQKERMDSFIAACAGRRITYKNLTA